MSLWSPPNHNPYKGVDNPLTHLVEMLPLSTLMGGLAHTHTKNKKTPGRAPGRSQAPLSTPSAHTASCRSGPMPLFRLLATHDLPKPLPSCASSWPPRPLRLLSAARRLRGGGGGGGFFNCHRRNPNTAIHNSQGALRLNACDDWRASWPHLSKNDARCRPAREAALHNNNNNNLLAR